MYTSYDTASLREGTVFGASMREFYYNIPYEPEVLSDESDGPKSSQASVKKLTYCSVFHDETDNYNHLTGDDHTSDEYYVINGENQGCGYCGTAHKIYGVPEIAEVAYKISYNDPSQQIIGVVNTPAEYSSDMSDRVSEIACSSGELTLTYDEFEMLAGEHLVDIY